MEKESASSKKTSGFERARRSPSRGSYHIYELSHGNSMRRIWCTRMAMLK